MNGYNPQDFSYFHRGENLVQQIIQERGILNIINTFEAVFDEIKRTFTSTRSTFKKVLFKKENEYTNRVFQVFFLAFYDLLVNEQKKIDNYQDLCKSLEGIGDAYFSDNAEKYNLSKIREQAIAAAKGFMSKYFSSRTENDPAFSNGYTRLRNLLSSSVTENTNYDVKIGFHRLEGNGNYDPNVIKKIVKTLTAMVNQDPGSVGYVVVGVADDKDDAIRYENFYKSKSESYKNFFITGVQEEALSYKSHDNYLKFIKDKVNVLTEVDDAFKSMVTRHMEYISFNSKTVLIFRANNEGYPVKYDGKFFERNGSHISEIKDEKLIWKRFV